MKVITYNVNGIRAVIKKGFVDWVKATNADVICLQEVKAEREEVPVELFESLGYYCFFHPAEKKGYSGVAIFTKENPQYVQYGYEPEYNHADPEGRVLRVDLQHISIMSVYMPSGTSGEDRQDFKFQWLDNFKKYIQWLKQSKPNLLMVGDYNICHQAIDIHNPKSNAKTSGFLPEERAWLTDFFGLGFIDSFRTLNKEPHHYTWWSVRGQARANNLGWRIDYQTLSSHLENNLKRAVILTDAKFSDHCPVMTELELGIGN